MTQKAITNTQKLSMVYCALREAMTRMYTGQKGTFTVMPVDVEAAWDLVKQSMHTYKQFKVKTLKNHYFKNSLMGMCRFLLVRKMG